MKNGKIVKPESRIIVIELGEKTLERMDKYNENIDNITYQIDIFKNMIFSEFFSQEKKKKGE